MSLLLLGILPYVAHPWRVADVMLPNFLETPDIM